jgi:hypothetical protein
MPKTPEQAAAAAEATEEPAKAVEFEFDGVTWTIAADAFEDLGVREHLEDGDLVLVAREMLGPQQWRRFRAKKRDRAQAYDLINAWGEAAGLGKLLA